MMPAQDAGNYFEGVTILNNGEVVIERTTAMLTKEEEPGGLRSWYGVIGMSFDDAFDLVGSDDVEIQMPDGKRGKVIVTNSGDTNVQVQGSGPAPF